MSGIAGIYFLDGRPAGPSTINRMVEAMAHRGPDGRNTWHDDSVALGHAMLHATPESLYETQPLVHRCGDLVLVADARIDNRDDLISALRPPSRIYDQPFTDAELILTAYEKWGLDCPKYLLGAFAFAIWDKCKRRLFCTRDHFGVKPLYYHHARGKRFVFATEIKGILASGLVSTSINEKRVADYLSASCLSQTYTFYDQVQRVQPGGWLQVGAQDVVADTYWVLELEEELCQSDDTSSDDHAAAFQDAFGEAVKCRVRSPDSKVGALLSGGLDSSSIVSMARQVIARQNDLHTYSAVFDATSETDERRYINAVLEKGTQISHFVNGNDYDPIADLPRILEYQDEPMMAPSSSLLWKLCHKVDDIGSRVLLDGHGGDEVVSHGYGYEKELARSRKWFSLGRELFRSRRRKQVSWRKMWLIYWFAFGPLPSSYARKGIAMVNRFVHDDRVQARRLLRRVVAPQLARRTRLDERLEAARSSSPQTAATAREYHFRALTDPSQTIALEELNHLSNAVGVESRFPFWDRRLVSFCLALPTSEKRRNGLGRYVLRQGLKNSIPEVVLNRRSKSNFLPSVSTALLESPLGLQVLHERIEHDALRPFVNQEIAKQVYDTFVSKGADAPASVVFALCRLHTLGCWLTGK